MQRVGLAIIARNEARNGNLTRLLDSIEGAFDRVILLDTGSTDGTVELFLGWAATQADMTYSTASFEWVEDFSAARNVADRLLLYGTVDELPRYGEPLVDWTSWADCDDTITNPKVLRQLTEQVDPQMNALIFGYDYGQHPANGACLCHLRRERLVRASHAGRWVGRVHEAQAHLEPVQYVPDDICHWRHHKQQEEGGAPRSNRRNLRILKGWAEDEPNNDRVIAYLGTEHAIRGMHKRAISYYRRYLKLDPAWREERAQIHRRYATSLMALDKFDEAEAIALQAITVMPEWPDNYLTLGELAMLKDKPEQAIYHAQRVLDLGPPQTFLIINPFDYAIQPHRLFAHAYHKLGRFEEAVQSARIVLEHQPDDMGSAGVYQDSRRQMKREHTAGTYAIAAEQLIAHDEQLKAVTLLECVPAFAIDHPRIVGMRTMLSERLRWMHTSADFAEHYNTGGSKPEDFHGDDMIAPICEQLPRVRFLLEGLDEQLAEAA